jgi:diguanylate cyclase (GGDEF)-like protein
MAARRILIVDDCPEDRAIYIRLLRGAAASSLRGFDYDFIESATGEEGLRLLADPRPDCVLLDYQLPDLSGLEFLSALIKEGDDPYLPVVMLTGHGSEAIAVQALKGGAFDYLTKEELSEDTLFHAVETAVEKSTLKKRIRQQRVELERLARFDSLTGLFNRRSLMERLDQEVRRAARYGPPLCVIMADLDEFKLVNDFHGHIVGDRVLARTADIVRTTVRATDVAGRYGGEEFCIILPETDTEGTRWFAERLRVRVAEVVYRGELDKTFRVTCSLGVAALDSRQPTAEAILQSADRSLYRAKNSGRNRVCVDGESEAADAPRRLPGFNEAA